MRQDEHNDGQHDAPHESYDEDVAHHTPVHGLDARVEHDALGPKHTRTRTHRQPPRLPRLPPRHTRLVPPPRAGPPARPRDALDLAELVLLGLEAALRVALPRELGRAARSLSF